MLAEWEPIRHDVMNLWSERAGYVATLIEFGADGWREERMHAFTDGGLDGSVLGVDRHPQVTV